MTRVFLSYSRTDMEFVQRLAMDLHRADLDVWWDLSDIQGSDVWERKIEEGLGSSQYFIVVLTPDSLESRWVRREYLSADNKGVKIIPLKLKAYRDMPLTLRDIQPIDAIGRAYEDVLPEVLKILKGQDADSPEAKNPDELEAKPSSALKKFEPSSPLTTRHDLAGTITLLAFFLFLSFGLFDDSSDELRALAALTGLAAAYLLWRSKQPPSGMLFKYAITLFFAAYDFMLLYFTTDWQIPGVETFAGVGGVILSSAIIASMQTPKKTTLFAAMFLAVFILLVSIHQGLNALSVYPSWPHMPTIIISLLAGVLIWRET